MRVAIIDYGIGNVQSVVNACLRASAEAAGVTDGEALRAWAPERIILPGVGAIGPALERLRARGFADCIEDLVWRQYVPFLGICVGMQMLAETCEEFGTHRGLGWIPGRVSRLGADDAALRVPHVGWNVVTLTDPDDPILSPLGGRDLYFVHSYAMSCEREFIAATTDYGAPFVSAVRRKHVLGVQFHPEKSSAVGLDFLTRFLG